MSSSLRNWQQQRQRQWRQNGGNYGVGSIMAPAALLAANQYYRPYGVRRSSRRSSRRRFRRSRRSSFRR